jgi:hypothetical protein
MGDKDVIRALFEHRCGTYLSLCPWHAEPVYRGLKSSPDSSNDDLYISAGHDVICWCSQYKPVGVFRLSSRHCHAGGSTVSTVVEHEAVMQERIRWISCLRSTAVKIGGK